jgi:preprotein translocase subunit YajC
MEALLPLIITFGLMWALLIRPQQRRVRQHQELVATLSAGDEVITTGGIVGTIVSVVDDIVTLEVAPGTSIRLLRSAVQTRIAAFPDEVVDDEVADDEVADDEALDDDMDEFEDDLLASEPERPPTPPAPPTPPTPEPDVSYIPPPPTTPPTTPPGPGEKA